MRKGLSLAWLLLGLLLVLRPAAVQAEWSHEWTYTTSGGEITITGGPGGAIPESINGLPVTAIAADAFMDPEGWLTWHQLVIPKTVRRIESRAFAADPYLADEEETVYFLGEMPTCGADVFKGCHNVTVYYMPWNAGWEGAFGGQPTEAWIPYKHTASNGELTITGYIGPGADMMDIPSMINGQPVTSIGPSALKNYVFSLRRVTLPNTVRSIGDSAFANCESLASITIPSGLTSLGANAFYHCVRLASITIPGGVPRIEASTFYGSGLTSVTIGNGVTRIEADAFYGCAYLTSVAIPDSVEYIGMGAFYLCTALNTATIGNGVGIIDQRAFSNCIKLASVTLGNSVTHINNEAFENCTSLTSINLPDSLTEIKGGAFQSCSSLTNVTIGSNVWWLADNAFHGCASLTSAAVPANVRTLGGGVFAGCTGLTDVTIVSTDGNIGINMFAGCTNLVRVIIGSSFSRVWEKAFLNCANLTEVYFQGNAPYLMAADVFDGATNATVYYPPGATGWGTTFGGRPTQPWLVGPPVPFTYATANGAVTISGYSGPGGAVTVPAVIDGLPVTRIGKNAFYNAHQVTSVTLPNSVTSIGDYAFYFCSKLNDVTIPESVTRIGSDAFYACASLTGITLPESVTSIGSNAFCACSSLTGITIPNGVTSIEANLFQGCTSLAGITLPNSVTSIGDSAFLSCSGLTGVTLPANLTSMGLGAFSRCAKLASITLPSSLTSIGGGVFSECTSLGSVTIPNSVTSIGDSAFSSCTSLTGITLPNSVTSIGDRVFLGCTGLTGFTLPANVTSIGEGAFADCTSLTAITVPPGNASYSSVDGVLFDIGMTTLIQCPAGKAGSYTLPSGVTSIAGWAFHSCGRLTSVTLPATLVAIGSEAFTHCTGLSSISIPDSVTSIDYSAFSYCSGLARVLIGTGVTSIGAHGLAYCPALKGVYFRGNAPVWGGFIFDVSPLVAVYYMPTSSGWEGTFGLRPTAPWDGNLYLLTVNGGTGGGSYPGGDQVAIAAGPAPGGQVFDRWTGATQHVAAVTSAGTTVTMPAESISVTATYKVIDDASYTYTTNNGAVTITKYTGTGSVVSIPAVINNLPVTSIGVSAFQGSASLTGVTLPASVTTIGDMAFYNCANLANVVIGAGVSSIGTNVFLSCPALGTITVNAANPFFSSMDGVLFNAGRTTLIQYPPGKTGSYAIPAGITTIGSRAFHRCTGLSSVTLPDSVIGIGDTAFANCSALTDVMIGNGITTIGSMAFYFCQALTSVTIPDSTTSIGPEAFSWCSGLTSVYIGAGVASLGTFQNCPSLGTITVAAANGSFCSVDGVLFDAGRTALIQCPAGKTGSYTIPAGVSNIGRMAFASCAGLARITLPDGLTGIEAWAFDSCTSLTGLTLPGSITSIGDGVFYACTALTGVYFEGNAPSVLGWGLFNGGANATVYYMLGATGWPAVPGLWAERPTALWSKGSAITHNGTTLTMNFVDIGHAGNAADPRIPSDPLNTARYGAVSDAYQIGKFEVTADQWDAVIAADSNVGNARTPYLPWSGTMPAAGITWFEAAKFCNWLTSGNAYSGAYQFSGGTLTGVDRAAALATYATVYVLPTEDEWYKAAYFKAAGSGYTLYPTGDTQPAAGPSGENYLMSGAAWDVGSGIAENNGTYDMGGNLWEWTESASDGTLNDMAERRELRGGHFDDSSDAYLRADRRIRAEPTYEDDYIVGFRVAAILAPPPPYTYTTSNGKITITKYTGPGGVVAIPATIDGKPVTSIAGWAFSDCASLTGVTIPDSVTSMGDAFFGCGNLTFITVADANPAYGSLNGVLFDKNRQTLLQYPGGKIGSYTIPAGVTSIDGYAFYNCALLTGVTLPAGVISLGLCAFYECTALTGVTIPDSVTSIGESAYKGCSLLISASFMGNAPTMSTKVFDSTASGFTVYYLNGKAGFTAPLWNGYPALEMDAYSPLATWLLANGLPPDANPQADPNSVGVSLLLAYALNLDPKRNLSASMPQPVMSANQMSLTFYAGSAGVSYTVESSSDLHTWSAAGVTLGALDANKLRTATVATSGRSRFLRLVVRY